MTIFMQIRKVSFVNGKIVRDRRNHSKLNTCWSFICGDIPGRNLINAR